MTAKVMRVRKNQYRERSCLTMHHTKNYDIFFEYPAFATTMGCALNWGGIHVATQEEIEFLQTRSDLLI